MLLRIKPEDVEIGMYIHAFEGRWIDHPFWRNRFLVETPEQLALVRGAEVPHLFVDRARSRLASMPDAADGAWRRNYRAPDEIDGPVSCGLPPADPLPTPDRIKPQKRASYARERRRAAALVDKSKRAVFDMFEDARLGRAVEVAPLVPLALSIGQSIERDSKALVNLVRLKEKDEYTYLHSVAVCALMMNFARQLDLDEAEVRDLGVAGLLHDLGKIAIADAILMKPGALERHERTAVENHPMAGFELLAASADIPEAALDVCRHHHEKVDGTGYPDRLRGDQLSLYARMGAICDVYDAVTSNRPYKDAWTPCEALTAMQSWEGHFDSELLDRFADSLGIFPVGTLVRLSTGLLGIVIGSDGECGEDVVVRAFFDCDALDEFPPFDQSIAPSAEHPRIVGRDSPTFWRFDNWDATRHRILAMILDDPKASQ